MKGSLVGGALALVLAGGCGGGPPAAETTSRVASAIQGGTSDTTDTFTVAVYLSLSGSSGDLCSGVLLAPNLVATARHCVAQLSSDQVDCATTTFGSVYPVSQLNVSNDPVLTTSSTLYAVSDVIVPTGAGQDKVCGNDIALLILAKNVVLPQYVEPVIDPPMTDHSAWSTTVTAIGYGVDSATDTAGTSAGTRRIKQDISLACIPDDTTFTDCYANPSAEAIVSSDEFESGDGTCPGDSGSGAFDQTQFDAGKWVAFGVLSRGDANECVGSVYSRFDKWSSLLVGAVTQASQEGGYALPAWATAAESDGGAGGGGGGGGGKKGGCSVTREPTHPVPWRAAALGLGVVALGLGRRRGRARP
jgi:secreted trypsin-like serine protease